ncbi:MAG: hypothetical protein IH623_32430 [Verrucomicrobia bacterium]|nr:hypothetical protein [Verrucomicrobiota bacterium]
MSQPILHLPPEHPLHKLPEPLRGRLAAAQRNLIYLEFPTAGAICAKVFDELRIQLAPPKDLAEKPVAELVDLPFQKLSELMLGILHRAGVPEASVDSLSKTIAQRIQLLRAFPDPDKTLGAIEAKILDVVNSLPKTAADIERGNNPGDVLDPYILAASQHLLFAGEFAPSVSATVSHKALMMIEGLIGHLHEDVLGEMRGNIRAPEPRGENPEHISLEMNPFPGADLVQPPWSAQIPLRFHQIKNKTGSAKGGDGKRLGDQLQRLKDTYGGEIFYDALIGNTLRGHRSRAGVQAAAPSVVVLVGEAAFEELTASRQGPQLLLRVYQAAFQEVARKSGYSVEKISATILEAFHSRAQELGEGFLESVLRVATSGPKSAQDSRQSARSDSDSESIAREEPSTLGSWLFAASPSSGSVSYRKTKKRKE